MPERAFGRFVERANHAARRLIALSAVVRLAELGDFRRADRVRRTAAGIVRQPPAVGGPDEVITRDYGAKSLARNRKRTT